MTETNQAVAKREVAPSKIAMTPTGLALTTLEDAYRFGQYLVKSGLAPKGDTPEAVVMKLQAGAELGLPPMRAMATLAVVNGKLSIMGEAVLALCRASGHFTKLRVGAEGEGAAMYGFVTFERKDTGEADTVKFSWADAQRAGLATKDTYKAYPGDMLMWKAVARFGKRYASDVCMGIEVAETGSDRPAVPVAVEPIRALPPADTSDDPIFEAEEVADANA